MPVTYAVYVNTQNRRATVHEADCVHLYKHGGVSYTNPPTGYYAEAIEGFDAAWAYALSTGQRPRACGDCIPDPSSVLY